MKKEEAFNIDLPKWSQCVINGEKITEEQALEIIRRTDTFFFGYVGNDHTFNERVKKICRIPDYKDFNQNWENYEKARKEFEEKWQLVHTDYIRNSWVSCSWIGGYHGWCHPDGNIGYCNNIGKYATVEEVYNDLLILGKNFPFLNLTCTLMDGEEDCCKESLVTMSLKNGKVRFLKTIPYEKLKFNGIKSGLLSFLTRDECYFDLEQIHKWADQVYEN